MSVEFMYRNMVATMGYTGFIIYVFTVLVIGVLNIIAYFKLFKKGGELEHTFWKVIIAPWATYCMFRMFWGNKEGEEGNSKFYLFTVLLYLVPIVNFVIGIMLIYYMAKSFGKGSGYFILMLLFSPIMIMILAFGKSQYIGPKGIKPVVVN